MNLNSFSIYLDLLSFFLKYFIVFIEYALYFFCYIYSYFILFDAIFINGSISFISFSCCSLQVYEMQLIFVLWIFYPETLVHSFIALADFSGFLETFFIILSLKNNYN
jgi:hypothetical protein